MKVKFKEFLVHSESVTPKINEWLSSDSSINIKSWTAVPAGHNGVRVIIQYEQNNSYPPIPKIPASCKVVHKKKKLKV